MVFEGPGGRVAVVAEADVAVFGAEVADPVAGDGDLAGEEPVADVGDLVVVGGGEAGLGEGVEGDAGVPDGGEAGLEADVVEFGVRVGLGDHEVVEVALGLLDDGVIAGVAEGLEGDLEVDHRGEDGAEALGGFGADAVDDPGLGELDGFGPHRHEAGLLHGLEGAIAEEEEVGPGDRVVALPLLGEAVLPLGVEEELVDVEVAAGVVFEDADGAEG